MNARESAFLSLQKYETSGVYSNIELSYAIERGHLIGAEKALYTALFYGVIERKLTLDYYISKVSARKLDDIDLDVKIILRIGLYQLLYMDKIPQSAAVNESVKLTARFYARHGSSAFVNGILRNFIREKDNISLPEKGTVDYLSVAYSVPKWICDMWVNDYGYAETEKMLQKISIHPPMTLRVNTLVTTADELLLKLQEKGIAAHKSTLVTDCIVLEKSVPLSELPENGEIHEYYIQDEASALAVETLGATKNDRILDACACPGGKSFGMAMMMANEGAIESRDLHKNKLSLIENGAKNLGISIIRTGVQNASKEADMGMFDKILLDVPCSGLGVIGKKPDIRYKEKEDIERLPALQSKILQTNSAYLKTGGTLVYSTCTVNKRENRDIVEQFLLDNPDFRLVPFAVNGKMTDGMLEIHPQDYRTDGFFIAKLTKVGDV